MKRTLNLKLPFASVLKFPKDFTCAVYGFSRFPFSVKSLLWPARKPLAQSAFDLKYSAVRERKICSQLCILERFSIECRKTKTKVLTTANQNKGKFQREPMRTQSKINTGNLPQWRKNASNQDTIGFSFAFDCLTRWCELYEPIRS